MSNFEKLLDAVDLLENGRKNAAKSSWNELPKDFRSKVMRLALTLNSENILDFKFGDLQLASLDGILPLGQITLGKLSLFVPELIAL